MFNFENTLVVFYVSFIHGISCFFTSTFFMECQLKTQKVLKNLLLVALILFCISWSRTPNVLILMTCSLANVLVSVGAVFLDYSTTRWFKPPPPKKKTDTVATGYV